MQFSKVIISPSFLYSSFLELLKIFNKGLTLFLEYSLTWANDHLRITIACQQRPRPIFHF